MRFLKICSPDELLRESLKFSLFSKEFDQLQERRIEATEKTMKRIVDQCEADPNLMDKLTKPIMSEFPEYKFLFWPALSNNSKMNLWTHIKHTVQDPMCHSFFVENDDGNLIGYCGYYLIDGKPESIHMFSWEKGLTRFDAFTMFNNLIEQYGEIQWDCVKGNPFEPVYDDYIKNKKLNGYQCQKLDMEKKENVKPMRMKEPIFVYKVAKS